MKTLQFTKISKTYNSKHGGQIFYVFFKGEKSYRTVLFDNMRNFKNWNEVINKAERGDYISNLRMKMYKGKEIVDADSSPVLYTSKEYMDIKKDMFEEEYGIQPY